MGLIKQDVSDMGYSRHTGMDQHMYLQGNCNHNEGTPLKHSKILCPKQHKHSTTRRKIEFLLFLMFIHPVDSQHPTSINQLNMLVHHPNLKFEKLSGPDHYLCCSPQCAVTPDMLKRFSVTDAGLDGDPNAMIRV